MNLENSVCPENRPPNPTERVLYRLLMLCGAVVLPTLATLAHPALGVTTAVVEALLFNEIRKNNSIT